MAAYNARVFAARHPEEVAAIVLIDGSHEDEVSKLPSETLAAAGPMIRVIDLCALIAPLGLYRIAGRLGWLEPFHQFSKLPPETRRAAEAAALQSGFCASVLQEILMAPRSAAQAAAARIPSDIPLVVVTSDRAREDPDKDGQGSAFAALARDLASMSSDSIIVPAHGSGHYIQLDRPQLVAETVVKTVEAVRRNRAVAEFFEAGPGHAALDRVNEPDGRRGAVAPENVSTSNSADARSLEPSAIQCGIRSGGMLPEGVPSSSR
ncbi:alpha/beta hydrolase [Candidatus Binatia bacterium]|jgi:pimeloyl-ACP methyl ester carboxylesterase|nr:alpha/beta hydrolase [Candidatus Binatia bacterium]